MGKPRLNFALSFPQPTGQLLQFLLFSEAKRISFFYRRQLKKKEMKKSVWITARGCFGGGEKKGPGQETQSFIFSLFEVVFHPLERGFQEVFGVQR